MAEILIKAVDATHADTEKNRRGCYKRGYPVVVMPDGHQWGREETKAAWIAAGNSAATWHNKFYLLKIPTVTVEKVLAAAKMQTTDDSGTPLYEADGVTPKVYRRREYYLNIDGLKTSIKNALNSAGEATVTVQDIRNDIKRIRDGALLPGM